MRREREQDETRAGTHDSNNRLNDHRRATGHIDRIGEPATSQSHGACPWLANHGSPDGTRHKRKTGALKGQQPLPGTTRFRQSLSRRAVTAAV